MPETPHSRRERPAKAALSRKEIVDTAMRILDEEGLGKVTTRRIAATLDTGPASLYVYVRNTEELYAHILDALIARMPALPANGPWRDRLRALLSSYAEILNRHPEVARMTIASHPDGPNYLAMVDTILELLCEGGVSDGAAAWGLDILLAAITATAVEHAKDAPNSRPEAVTLMEAAIRSSTAEGRYPRIAELRDELVSGTPEERFNWSLEVLINGILATVRD